MFAEKATTSLVNKEVKETIEHNGKVLSNVVSEKKKGLLQLAEIKNKPPKSWVLQNWFSRKDIGIIYGESTSGKTFMVIDLMFQAMTEETFANTFEFNERLKCLYICGEGYTGIYDRLKAKLETKKLPEDINDYFFLQETMINLSSAIDVDNFICERLNEDLDLGLIVIDTLISASFGANENDNPVMAGILKNAAKIAKALNVAIILIHHTNKNGNMRGAQSLMDNSDFMIECESSGNQRTISAKKVKDGAIWKDIYFSLQSVDLQDGGNSAIVVWGENEKTVKGKDLVFKLLHDNLTKNYTYEEIYNELVKVNVDISLDSIKTILKMDKSLNIMQKKLCPFTTIL